METQLGGAENLKKALARGAVKKSIDPRDGIERFWKQSITRRKEEGVESSNTISKSGACSQETFDNIAKLLNSLDWEVAYTTGDEE
eukprot:4601623-Karenia_brevis.AAC.1